MVFLAVILFRFYWVVVVGYRWVWDCIEDYRVFICFDRFCYVFLLNYEDYIMK